MSSAAVMDGRLVEAGEQLPERENYRLLPAICVIMAVALGRMIQVGDGNFNPEAIFWLTVCVGAALPLLLGRRLRRLEEAAKDRVVWLAGVGLAAALAQWLTCKALTWHGPEANWLFRAGMMALGLVVAAGLAQWRWAARVWFVAAVAAYAGLGLWVIRATPTVHIDVRAWQQEGARAYLAGEDPFTISFADVHHKPYLYPPNTVRDGRVHLGFPYPPLTLLMDLPGYLLGGDFRYSNLAAMVMTALLIGYMRPGKLSKMAALLFLFTPRGLMVLECGWTEPTVALMLAGTVFCAIRRSWATAYVLGLFLVSKQYLVFAVLPALVLLPRGPGIKGMLKLAALAALTGLAVTLPVVLRDLHGFIHVNWLVHVNFSLVNNSQRYDAISYLVFSAYALHRLPPAWTGFALAGLMSVAAVRRLPRTPAAFAAAVAVIYLLFFAFGKLAFANYYYLVIAGACCAAAAWAENEQADGQLATAH